MEKKSAGLVEMLFLGPTHLLEAFGQTVKRGESALFSEAEAFALQAENRIHLEVLGVHRGDDDTADGDEPSEPEADTGEGHDETHEEEA